jgi:hypothetical protein
MRSIDRQTETDKRRSKMSESKQDLSPKQQMWLTAQIRACSTNLSEISRMAIAAGMSPEEAMTIAALSFEKRSAQLTAEAADRPK